MRRQDIVLRYFDQIPFRVMPVAKKARASILVPGHGRTIGFG